MYVKNYTSTVPADETIATIEWLLANAGATGIAKEYEAGVIKSIVFTIKAEFDWPVMVRLPVDPPAVYDALKAMKKGKLVTEHQKAKLREQAERTAWRLMEDWLRVQLSLISMRQAKLGQVFMPYMMTGGPAQETLYQRFVASPERMLKGRSDDEQPAIAGKVGT